MPIVYYLHSNIVPTLYFTQACSNAQHFLSQNLDDAMNQFVVPNSNKFGNDDDGTFNEALQGPMLQLSFCCDWRWQKLRLDLGSMILIN